MMQSRDTNVIARRAEGPRSCDVSFGAVFADPWQESDAMVESEIPMPLARIAVLATLAAVAVVVLYLACLFTGSNPVSL